jgi:hypothetical protein
MNGVKVYLKSGQTVEFTADSLPDPGDVPNWIASLTSTPLASSPGGVRTEKLVHLNIDDIAAIVVVV